MELNPPDLRGAQDSGFRAWWKDGDPWIWMTGGGVAISVMLVVGLLSLIAVRGLAHFWPADVVQGIYEAPGADPVPVLAEIRSREDVATARLKAAGLAVEGDQETYERVLLRVGNRDLYGSDFRYGLNDWLKQTQYPKDATVWERLEWGNLIGFLLEVQEAGETIAQGDAAWGEFQARQQRVLKLRSEIHHLEKSEIGRINYQLENLRLKRRGFELKQRLTAERDAQIREEEAKYQQQYSELEKKLVALHDEMARDSIRVKVATGEELTVPLAKIVRGYRPNAMNAFGKIAFYGSKVWEFISEEPREANTEGGIFPAIFGTVMMVLLMSVFVTPFGVIAALYLREYAKQGFVTQTIRVAVNNLAGVPSIVYGVFGLGFFVYFLGGSIDELFFPEALPNPTFGTGGLLWASLTLAILTLPVVIVATEEGLARIPRSVREASLALGATRAETLWRVVLPMSSPAMMTGLILAVARAAGEVAPLMLVGVVKLAPSLPLDSNAPFLHLDRKFMHLGFHIYDVGFQSPNVEAARPLVYATALLLVLVIVFLNLFAVRVRNRLREKYRALEH